MVRCSRYAFDAKQIYVDRTASRPKLEPEESGTTATETGGWRELWRKEDWWAVWIGLGIVAASCIAFANGTSLRWLAVLPARWSSVEALAAVLGDNGLRYLALFGFWAALGQ